MEFCLPGILKVGDVEVVLRIAAPRAVFIQGAESDKWSRGAQEMFDSVRSVFPDGQLDCGFGPEVMYFQRKCVKQRMGFSAVILPRRMLPKTQWA